MTVSHVTVWRFYRGYGFSIEEVATAALFLASPAASYGAEAALVIDGGYTTR